MKLLLILALMTTVAALPNRECPMYKCVPCPGGYEVDQDGCQTCTCKEEKRAVCSGVMCLMFCINGFATGPDGCPICSCA